MAMAMEGDGLVKYMAVRLEDRKIHGTEIQLGRASVHDPEYPAVQNNALFEDPLVSRRHALLTFDPTCCIWKLEDCGSTHGTLLNRQSKLGDITYGDHITLGGSLEIMFEPVLCAYNKTPVEFLKLLVKNDISFRKAGEAILMHDMTGERNYEVPFVQGAESIRLLDDVISLHSFLVRFGRHDKFARLDASGIDVLALAREHCSFVRRKRGLASAPKFRGLIGVGKYDEVFAIDELSDNGLVDKPEIISLVDEDQSNNAEDEEISTDTESSSSPSSGQSFDDPEFHTHVHSLHPVGDDTDGSESYLDDLEPNEARWQAMDKTVLREAENEPGSPAQQRGGGQEGDVFPAAQVEISGDTLGLAGSRYQTCGEVSSIDEELENEMTLFPEDGSHAVLTAQEQGAFSRDGPSTVAMLQEESNLSDGAELEGEGELFIARDLTNEMQSETQGDAGVESEKIRVTCTPTSRKRGHSELESASYESRAGCDVPSHTIIKRRRAGHDALYLITGALIGGIGSLIALVASAPDEAMLDGGN